MYIISSDATYVDETGRLDIEKLNRLVTDIKEREIYLCGPVPMMDGAIKLLKELDVRKAQIHYEKFSL